MERLDMNNKQKAEHTEQICSIILSKQKDHAKVAGKIKDQILILNDKLDAIQEVFDKKQEKFCRKERISYRFVKTILSRNRNREEEVFQDEII